jgi:hypothetical protein
VIVIKMEFACHGEFSSKFAWKSKFLRAVSISEWAAFIKGFRASRTTSHPDAMLGISGRRVSLKIRFARLRWTAFPIVRLAAVANRELSILFGWAINTINGWAYDFPYRRTRSKSVELVKRNLRLNELPWGWSYL